MNKEILKRFGYDDYIESIENGKCPFCEKVIDPKEFTDELSVKEFKLSGLCQKCQDKTFKGGD